MSADAKRPGDVLKSGPLKCAPKEWKGELFVVKINYWAVAVAGLAAFVMSSLYYSPPLLGDVWRAVDPAAATAMTFSPWKLLVEIPRTFGVAFVMARLLTMLGGNDVKSAFKLALWLWFGFSALMWVGAVTWEQNPWQVAAIHSGDWLVKTLLIASILRLWRPRVRTSPQPHMPEGELAC